MCSFLCTASKIEWEGEFPSLFIEMVGQCLKGKFVEVWAGVGIVSPRGSLDMGLFLHSAERNRAPKRRHERYGYMYRT